MNDNLADLAWPALRTAPVVLVPLGSTEQHGPHLPLHTDTTIASAVANRVVARLSSTFCKPVLVAPAVAYGASGEHQDFPGTMSIGTEAMRLLLVELVRSVSSWAGRVVFVNGHGGNIAALIQAVVLLRHEQHDVVWVPCADDQGDVHAGHTETSLMLHAAPHLVDMRRAAPGNTEPLVDLLPTIRRGGVGAASPSGVLGNPTTASREEGIRVVDLMVEDMLDRIQHDRADRNGCLQRPEHVVGPA
jgi:mycofactocin precursor peptide peptidase